MIRTAGIIRARRDRVHEANDDGIALLSAILFMVVMAGLSLVLLSVIMAQLVPAATAQKRTQTINAAEAGLEATLGVIRSAKLAPNAAGVTYGDISDLPCSVTGKVDGTTTATTYTSTVRYYNSDPSNQTETWLTANKLACSTTAGVASQPLYALITSKGDGGLVRGVTATGASNRSVTALYQFKVTNVNIPGGRVYDSTGRYCLEATSASAGSVIRFVGAASCNIDARQLWSYDDDYQIKLSSSVTSTSVGLCITGPVNDGEATQSAKLAACKAKTDAARWNQLWSWTGDYSWRGQKKDISQGPSNYCLSPGASDNSDFTGIAMQVRTSCFGTFLPAAKVGAGSAGYGSKQIVNYKEFGRCADVTNETTSSSFMITYPCKQDPTGTGTYLVWNHKWYYTEPTLPATTQADQEIFIYQGNDTSKKFCLQTPSTGSGNIYPTFQGCSTAKPPKKGGTGVPTSTIANQNWTRAYDTKDYASSYVITDSYDRCLTADSSILFNGYSRISVRPCDGTTAQKWNAPPIASTSEVGGYRETAP